MFPGPFSSQGPGNHARQMVSATDFYSLKEKMNNDMLFDFYNTSGSYGGDMPNGFRHRFLFLKRKN